MKPGTKMVVVIVAYGEGSRIRNTLDQLSNQNLKSDQYEIVLLDNHPEKISRDNTLEEVDKFKQDHPEVSIVYSHKVWKSFEKPTVGNARRYAFDIAQQRILSGGISKDTVLVCNDADAEKIDENYLNSILNEFNTHANLDALVTHMDLPLEALQKPNVAAGFYLLEAFDEAYTEGVPGAAERQPATLNGRSSAFRASIYSAVGGFNHKALIAEDSELGWLMSDARDWNPNRITYLQSATLTTDPRRYIDAVVKRIPVDQMLIDFGDRPELRNMNNAEILEITPTNFDWELFQDELDSLWNSQFTGANRRVENFQEVFSYAMEKLGVTYEIIDEKRLIMKDANKLLEKLRKFSPNLDIVHSEPRIYTPELISKIKSFFHNLHQPSLRQEKDQKVKLLKLHFNFNMIKKLGSGERR